VPTRAQAAGFDDDGDDDGFGGGAKRAKPAAMKDSFDSDSDFTTPPPPPARTTEENGNVVVLVYHKHAGLGHGLFGAPLILCFTATPTYLELARAIYDQIKRTLHRAAARAVDVDERASTSCCRCRRCASRPTATRWS
jgi:hypothetical protein